MGCIFDASSRGYNSGFATEVEMGYSLNWEYWAQPRAGLKPRAGSSPPAFKVGGLVGASGKPQNHQISSQTYLKFLVS